MKKVGFALVACITLVMATLFVSCNDDDNKQPENPIAGIELPKCDADHPISSGRTVEIKGTGFSASCEVWLQPAATRADAEAVKVDVTVTSTGISFVAPALAGKYDIVLKQEGESYTLGSLFFTAERLFAASVNDDVTPEVTVFYEYDSSVDTFVEHSKVQGDLWKAVLAGAEGMIYYFKDEGLFSYNLNTKTEKHLLNDHWLAKQDDYITGTGQAIGLIGGELHGVKYSQKDGFTVVKISEDGKETEVKRFPEFTNIIGDPAVFYCEDDNLLFVYDETSKTIVLTGWVETSDGEDVEAIVVSLGLNEPTPHAISNKELDSYSFMKVGDEFWLTAVTEKEKTVFRQIVDLKELIGMEIVTGLEEEEFDSPVYGEASHTIYFTGDNDELKKYNVTTKQVTESKATLPTPSECLFIAK